MDNLARYQTTLLEMTALGLPAAGRCLHAIRGDRLVGAWRDAVGDRAGDYRYEACCAQVGLDAALGQEPRPFPCALLASPDGAATAALQLWDQRVWWDDSGLYLEARWRPATGAQPYSLHGLGPDGRLPRDQRVREAIAMLGAVQGSRPGPRPSEEGPDSPYWRLIDPIMDQKRKGRTIDQIAVYLGLNPGAVRRYVGVYDGLHPGEKS
jgi:hypothetical protein